MLLVSTLWSYQAIEVRGVKFQRREETKTGKPVTGSDRKRTFDNSGVMHAAKDDAGVQHTQYGELRGITCMASRGRRGGR
jgi:hypothetical protein